MYVEMAPWKVEVGIFPKKLSFLAFKGSEWDIIIPFLFFFIHIFSFINSLSSCVNLRIYWNNFLKKLNILCGNGKMKSGVGCIWKKTKIVIPLFLEVRSGIVSSHFFFFLISLIHWVHIQVWTFLNFFLIWTFYVDMTP
jgi:hypothetical protein